MCKQLFFFLILMIISCSREYPNIREALPEEELKVWSGAHYGNIELTVVAMERKEKEGYRGYGTGFFIEHDSVILLASARHLLGDLKDNIGSSAKQRPVIRFVNWFRDASTKFIRVPLDSLNPMLIDYLVHKDTLIDVTLVPILYTELLPKYICAIPSSLLVPYRLINPGTDVYCYGFPVGFEYFRHPFVRKGAIVAKADGLYFYYDGNTWPGDSGAPLFGGLSWGISKKNEFVYLKGPYLIGIHSGLPPIEKPDNREEYRKAVSSQAILDILNSPIGKTTIAKIKKYSQDQENKKSSIKKQN